MKKKYLKDNNYKLLVQIIRDLIINKICYCQKFFKRKDKENQIIMIV